MKIASSSVALQSSHVAFSRRETSERLDMWVGERPRADGARVQAPPRPSVALSEKGLSANETAPATDKTDELDTDPRMLFLRYIIEALTGRPVRTLRPDYACLTGDPAPSPVQSPAEGSRESGSRRAGFGIEYDFRTRYEEYERTGFRAEGVARTAEGQEIRFSLDLAMERSYSETSSVQLRIGDARLKDPLVLDFAGPGAVLSDVRFAFDLDADGNADAVPLPGGGSGYLAIDRNANGRIDDGSELFGPTSGDGFAELAALDGDSSGWVDEGDAAWSSLRIWTPALDGGGMLRTATEAGVGALYTGRVATPFDLRGAANETLGVVRTTGIYLRDDGGSGTVSQIDVSV